MNVFRKLLALLRKLSRAIGIFEFSLHRRSKRKGWGSLMILIVSPFVFVDVFAVVALIVALDGDYNSKYPPIVFPVGSFIIICALAWFPDSLKKYFGTKYDTDRYERKVIRRSLLVFVGVFVGFMSAVIGILALQERKTDALRSRVDHSFEYEGTERDSIAAASVIGAVDTLLQISVAKKKKDEIQVRLLKFAVLARARRFDQARDFVKESDFAKGLYPPGYGDYLNLRIDFLENKARGNDSALAATVRELCDYLRKQVAAPELEMDSLLKKEDMSRKARMRAGQLTMLKALTVHFKEPADTAELAHWLRTQYPDTEYQYQLTRMPDKAEAEARVFAIF